MRNLSFIVMIWSAISCTDVSAFKTTANFNVECATCTGSRNCYACKNCKYCKHCNAGGKCGVCSSALPTLTRNLNIANTSKKRDVSISSICQGTTKKGVRCKRVVKNGSYCFQHD